MKITDLNGYWFKADKETFDTLVEAGYSCMENFEHPSMTKFHVDNGTFVRCREANYKQAFHHNGEFFTRNENGEIRGLWITDVPLIEEQAYIDACEIAGLGYDEGQGKLMHEKRDYMRDDGTGGKSWFYPWGNWLENDNYKITWQEFIEIFGDDEHRERWLVDEDGFTEVARIPITEEEEKAILNDESELTYSEQVSTARGLKGEISNLECFSFEGTSAYVDFPEKEQPSVIQFNGVSYFPWKESVAHGLEEGAVMEGQIGKEPFPASEDIENVKITIPEWMGAAYIKGFALGIEYPLIDEFAYKAIKNIYENSKDFTVTWKLKETDPHTKIKARWAEAKKAEENGGPIVHAMMLSPGTNQWAEVRKPTFEYEDAEYELRFYEIAFEKVLETSYRDGEFVECEFGNSKEFKCDYGQDDYYVTSKLYGVLPKWFIGELGGKWEYCRLPKGTEIKPEWLKEIKDA